MEDAKRAAAIAAVDNHVKDGFKVGIGSGSTIKYAVERLKERVNGEGMAIVCVPTSFQARQLIVEGGLELGDLERFPALDVAIDGADEVDSELNCIKGGGGCQTQEKIVAASAKLFIVIADNSKDSMKLGSKWKKGVPLEVIPMAYKPILNRLKTMDAEGKLRMATSKAGPCVTDNGNFIIDANFGVIEPSKVPEIENKLNAIPGIVSTGLFVKMAAKVYFGSIDGEVNSR